MYDILFDIQLKCEVRKLNGKTHKAFDHVVPKFTNACR